MIEVGDPRWRKRGRYSRSIAESRGQSWQKWIATPFVNGGEAPHAPSASWLFETGYGASSRRAARIEESRTFMNVEVNCAMQILGGE